MKLAKEFMRSNAPRATILIRMMVGCIFLSEGIQKFLEPAARGAGRFAKIGIPWPEVSGPFVGGMEIVCSILLLAGFATRFAAIPLILTMAGALLSTKIPILLGHGFWGSRSPSASEREQAVPQVGAHLRPRILPWPRFLGRTDDLDRWSRAPCSRHPLAQDSQKSFSEGFQYRKPKMNYGASVRLTR